MKISEVYKKYSIPPNLADHMFLVAKVAIFISNHWVGEKIGKDELKKTALVHDLGNIVRFDFDEHPEFLGSEVKNMELWKKKQKEIIAKYGYDDHKATGLILKELNFSNESIKVISSKSFVNSVVTLNSDNWNLKILLYSDLRVSPAGVVSLEERLKEILARRPDIAKNRDVNIFCDACFKIEKQIQSNVDISLDRIDSASVQMDNNELLNLNI